MIKVFSLLILIFIFGCTREILPHKLGISSVAAPFTCSCGHNWATFKLNTGEILFITIGGHNKKMYDQVIYSKLNNNVTQLSEIHRIELAIFCHKYLLKILGKQDYDKISQYFKISLASWDLDIEELSKLSKEINKIKPYSENEMDIRTLLYMESKLIDFINYKTPDYAQMASAGSASW